MYVFRVKADGKDQWDLLDLVREIPIDELPVPIRNKR
jgi:branched-chain amino acid transport system substrate-binding protein